MFESLFNLVENFLLICEFRKSAVKRGFPRSFVVSASNLNKQRVILSILIASEFDVFQVKEEILNSISDMFPFLKGSSLKVNGITFK